MKGFNIFAILLLAIAFAGILVDYKPNHHATALSYWSCVPLAAGALLLIAAGIKNQNK